MRKLKKENARLQEELSMTQQTPREEVTCKGEITDSRKKVVQLRLMFNSQVSERMLKEKQLINLSNKVQTINMELGEDPNLTPTSNRVDTPSSSMKSLMKMTAKIEQEHERLKGLLIDTDENITDLECYTLMLQHRKRQYMLKQNSMESQYSSLRKQLNILDRQHHEIKLNVRTLEHGEITASAKAEDIMGEIHKYARQREELKVQQKQKKEKQERIQDYMQSRELNRQNLKKEMNGDAWDNTNQEEGAGSDLNTSHVVDIMFERFMDTLVERIGIGSNLSAMLQKLENMNDTQEEVQNRKVETEIKLQNLEKEKVQLEQQLQEIAVNGTDFSFRRHEMDEIEDKTHQSASRLKYLMSHLDRAGKQIAGAQIGIEAILNKLDYLKVRAPADQQKVEAKPDKIGAPMGIQSMTGADTHKGEHRGQDGLSIEEHEDPLLRQLEIVDQKLGNIVDALAASTMGKTAGDMHTEGEAEGPATTMSWLKTDFQKLGLAEPQQGQYNLRVNLTTPTAAMASHPSSAGAFDADGLSDDSLEQDTRPRKKYSIMPKQGQALAKKRNKSKSAIMSNSKPKPSRAKQSSVFSRG